MFVLEKEFFQATLGSLLQGRQGVHVVIANAKLADMYNEGEMPQSNNSLRISILHSTENGTHISRLSQLSSEHRAYVLYSAQRETMKIISVAQRIHQQDPGCTLIVVTCDCDHKVKRSAYAQVVMTKQIDCVVFTPDCGTVTFMMKFIDALKKFPFSRVDDPVQSLP